LGESDDVLVDAVTDFFKTPWGNMRLRPIQAQAIKEAAELGGLFAPIGVGHGKTLVSLLLPEAMQAQRPLLLIPANLRDKTINHDIPDLEIHWRLHPNLKIMSYSQISTVNGANSLLDMMPDLIILDEAHKLKNHDAARTKRFLRYFDAFPETRLCAMSGSMTKRSILDYAHLSRLALKERSPLPKTWHELRDWSCALDSDVPPEMRKPAGAMADWCDTKRGRVDLSDLRKGFKNRLCETPGVITSKKSAVECGLILTEKKVKKIPEKIEDAFQLLRERWITPGGEEISDALSLWRHSSELACGFYYRWNPMPPRGWLDARAEWHRFVRHKIQYSKGKYDTMGQVALEIQRGMSSPQYDHWKEIEPTFEPNTEAVWVDDFLVKEAEKWALKEQGIVWVAHRAVGERFNENGRIPYFGAGDDAALLAHKGACAASIAAHGTGKNLQAWSRGLLLVPPASGDTFEQLLGRFHRPGQAADDVCFDVCLHTKELFDGFLKAQRDAVYIQESTGLEQKLNLATIKIEDERGENTFLF